jgi:ribonuclease-3
MDNPVNKLITREDVKNILNYYENIGDDNTILVPNNLEYFQRAFVHDTYLQSIQSMQKTNDKYFNYIPEDNYQRLEFLGDNILKSIMGNYLFERFPDAREGFLTKLKIKIEQCDMLHKIGKILGFEKFLLLSLQEENKNILDINSGRFKKKHIEDCFEAFIGAMMIDLGYRYAERFVKSIIENTLDFAELISQNSNFKDSLQKFFFEDRDKLGTPNYFTINESGPGYRKVFTIMLTINSDQLLFLPKELQTNISRYTDIVVKDYKLTNHQIYEKIIKFRVNGLWILGIGFGRCKKDAEQECAKKCMDNLELPQDY